MKNILFDIHAGKSTIEELSELGMSVIQLEL